MADKKSIALIICIIIIIGFAGYFGYIHYQSYENNKVLSSYNQGFIDGKLALLQNQKFPYITNASSKDVMLLFENKTTNTSLYYGENNLVDLENYYCSNTWYPANHQAIKSATCGK